MIPTINSPSAATAVVALSAAGLVGTLPASIIPTTAAFASTIFSNDKATLLERVVKSVTAVALTYALTHHTPISKKDLPSFSILEGATLSALTAVADWYFRRPTAEASKTPNNPFFNIDSKLDSEYGRLCREAQEVMATLFPAGGIGDNVSET